MRLNKKVIISAVLTTLFIATPAITLAFDPSYLFTDQEKDFESGMYYFDAREYNPVIGKFIQPDPILQDGELNSFFLRPENKDQLQEILMDPQKLNPYSYTRNNPINYVDPTGESEISAWILNPKLTAAGVVAWSDFSETYFRNNGYSISAAFLERSLKLRIGNNLNLNIRENKDKYNVINTIKQSNDYKSFAQDRIKEAEANGLTEFYFEGGEGTANSQKYIIFTDGDLKLSIHETTTYITGKKLDNGQWDLSVRLTDVYNFKLEGKDKYNGDFITTTGNNAAFLSQTQGAISNYQINIQFNDRLSR